MDNIEVAYGKWMFYHLKWKNRNAYNEACVASYILQCLIKYIIKFL